MCRISYLVLLIMTISCSSEKQQTFDSGDWTLAINSIGKITELTEKGKHKNHLLAGQDSWLLSLKSDSVIYHPVKATWSAEKQTVFLTYENKVEVEIRILTKKEYIRFEVLSVSDNSKVDAVIWGPYFTDINKSIGETVGVVRGQDFALGIQALNPKTLGGYPWTDNDCMPQIDIFEQDDLSDLSEENKRGVLYRVEAAKPVKEGSSLQAYCRNRNKERIIRNLDHDKYVSPVSDDGGVTGSKIALFGCPVENTLDVIGNIETGEGLPHPLIDGKWGKKVPTASAAYLIYSFNESNIDEAIKYTKQAGVRYLYHPGPFKTWGHFELNEKEFPHGRDGLKMCVEKAQKEGIFVGLHTLSNFTTTNDPYVTPVPDPRLGKVGSSVLSENIDESQKEIPIESPDFFNQYKNNKLHTVMIGEELIRYESVSKNAPWKLLNCERGAWKTSAGSHSSGEKISKLADHGYKVFLTDAELGMEEAKHIADLFNYCGLRQISFDGLEGNRSTGMGNYGEILFTTTWWNHLSDEIKKHVIIDASRTSHYFWHIYSRMNWGEPWYAGFRESQTEYRLKNQAYFQRNLMPGMLGWFSMRNNTTVEDIEWMLARSAAFDAGYAFVTNERALKTNGQTDEILQLIGEWEKARMGNAFSEDQKERMKDIKNEFHLETTGENQWKLTQIHSYKFRHEMKEKQPGEPLFSTFRFDNPEDNNVAKVTITAQDASISGMKIEIDNCCEVDLPVKLKAGESAYYQGDGIVTIRNEFLQKTGEIKIDGSSLRLSKGEHTFVFDCTFSDKGKEPAAKMEIRVSEKPEMISI